MIEASAGADEGAADPTPSPEELQEALPPRTALVDVLVHATYDDDGARMVAFVVRSDREIRRVDLGAIAPLEEAVETWRRDHGRSGGEALRRLVWEPLVPRLDGVEKFRIDTPAASVYLLGDGDFRVEVDGGKTEIFSRRGVARSST